jgi:hypothetical protein
MEIEFIIKILFKLTNKDIMNLFNLDFYYCFTIYIYISVSNLKSGWIILIAICNLLQKL